MPPAFAPKRRRRAAPAAASPEVYRVAFVEAATVIGPQQWREIEMKYAFGALHAALADLEARGELKGLSADTLAPMLLGALHEAAVTIAEAADKDAARINAARAIGRMLDGLIPSGA